MSIAARIDQLRGTRKSIWRKTSTCSNRKNLLQNIQSYLDERTKVQKVKPPTSNDGLYYLTKNNTGRLHAMGFLREDIIAETGTMPHLLHPKELVEVCSTVWGQRLDKFDYRTKKAGQKIVLSLPAKITDVMAELGSDPDELLLYFVRNTLRRYQEKYYPESKLGYLVGLHHDTRYAHAHIYVFPKDQNGKMLSFSNQNSTRGDSGIFTFLREYTERTVEKYFRDNIEPVAKQAENDPLEITQRRLLVKLAAREEATIAPDYWGRVKLKTDYYLQLPKSKLQEKVEKSYRLQSEDFHRLPSPLSNTDYKRPIPSPEVAAAELAQQRMILEEQKKKLLREMRESMRRSEEIFQQHNTLRNDMSIWSHGKWAFQRGLKGAQKFGDSEKQQKLLKRLCAADSISNQMRETLGNLAYRDVFKELSQDQMRDTTHKTHRVGEKLMRSDYLLKNTLGFIADKAARDAKFRDKFYRSVADPKNFHDWVSIFLKAEMSVCKEEQDRLHEKRKALKAELDAIKMKREILLLDGMDKLMRFEGKQPEHIAQFLACQKLKIKVPLAKTLASASTKPDRGFSHVPEWAKEAHAALLSLRQRAPARKMELPDKETITPPVAALEKSSVHPPKPRQYEGMSR